MFYVHCIKLEKSQSHHFLIHSLNRFVLKKKCLHVVGFLQLGALYANIHFKCLKVDGEENLFDFYVESVAFKMKILININIIISDSRLCNSNMRISTYLDQTQAINL